MLLSKDETKQAKKYNKDEMVETRSEFIFGMGVCFSGILIHAKY